MNAPTENPTLHPANELPIGSPPPLPDNVPPASQQLDKKGTPYDPEKHNLRLHPTTGVWMPRGGRPSKAEKELEASRAHQPAAADFSDVDRIASAGDATLPPVAAPTAAIGSTTAETAIGIIQTALVLIGEDEGILSTTEKALLLRPLERVLKKYNIGDDALPAEVDLAVALAGIVIERIRRGGKTATWFSRARAWVIGVIWRRKGAHLGDVVRREAPETIHHSQ